MTPGGKRPYLDFQKYKYDEDKRGLFSFTKKKEKSKPKKLKIYEMPPQDPINYTVGSNPFRKEAEQKRNYKRIFSAFFIASFFVAWFWLMFYLPYFDVDKISYYGIKALNADEIKGYVYDNYLKSSKYWHRNNYFIVKPEKMMQGLKQKFDVNDVKVVKTFPDTMEIEIIEKNQSLTYCTPEGYYLLDNDGKVIKIFWENPIEETTTSISIATGTVFITSTINTTSTPIIFKPTKNKIDNEYRNLPLYCIAENKKLDNNQKDIISVKLLESVIFIQETLSKEGIGAPEYFIGGTTEQSGLEAYFKDKRWYLKIVPENIEQQILKLKTILTGNEGGAKANEYIDVRFEDRVFWK